MNKTKKNQKVQQPVITEEDKQTTDPFLRALAKKIRNINKKLTQIETLERRSDLKPEQQQKISSKPSIIEERKKYQEFVKFYKTTLSQADNTTIAPPISKISNVLVAAQFLRDGNSINNIQFTNTEKKTLLKIGNIDKQDVNIKTLSSNLSLFFGQYFDNQKLVTKVQQAFSFEDSLNIKVNQNQPEVTLEKVVQETTSQQQKIVVQETQQQVVIQPVVQQPLISTPVTQNIQIVQTQVNQVSQTIVSPPIVPQQDQQNIVNTIQSQQEKQPQRNNQYPRKYDSNKSNYRPKNGGYREGGYKPYQGTDKRLNKPKYQEKGTQQDDRRSDTSLQDSEDESNKRRKFNNRQINELQNDGFVVVQKKPHVQNYNNQYGYQRKQYGYKERVAGNVY